MGWKQLKDSIKKVLVYKIGNGFLVSAENSNDLQFVPDESGAAFDNLLEEDEVPVEPETPVEPELPGDPEPEVPVEPETPVEPELPGDPEPEVPTEPEIPVEPELPGDPEPEVPTEPEIPVEPEPEVPTEPEIPAEPEPETPIEPEVPVDPPVEEPEVPVEPIDPEPELPVEPPVEEPEIPVEPVYEYLDVVINGLVQPRWANYSWSTSSSLIGDKLRLSISGWGGFNLHMSPTNEVFDIASYDQLEIEQTPVSGDESITLNLTQGTTDRVSYPLKNKGGLSVHLIENLLGSFTNVVIKGASSTTKVFDLKSIRLRKKLASTVPVEPEPEVPTTPPITNVSGWLKTSGNQILNSDNTVWMGRGVNIFDTRSCRACYGISLDQSVQEIKRRIDFSVTELKTNFFRLCLDSWSGQGNIMQDANNLAAVKEVIAHIKTKPGAKVLLSNWIDDTFVGTEGVPTVGTDAIMRFMVREFANESHVMFGIANEPEYNFDGADNDNRWMAYNRAVQAVRSEEALIGCPAHIVAVQGLAGWGRNLSYYVTKPITAGGGTNVVYETHVYNATSDFNSMVSTPKNTLPVIVGEYGPASGYMTETDCQNLMVLCETLKVPYLAWALHMRCPPNMLVDNSNGGCGAGMPLQLTSWGNLFKTFTSST